MTRRLVWLAVGGVLLWIYTAAHYVHGAFWYRGYGDFFAMLHAVRGWLATGQFTTEYLYPPFFYLLTAPLALLSNDAALRLMVGIDQVLLIACLGLCAAAMSPTPPYRLWVWVLLPLALNFRPLLLLLSMAKIELVQLTLLLGGLMALQRGRLWVTGVLVALAGMIKPLPLVLILYFIWKRYWRVVWAWLVTITAVLALCSVVFGVGNVVAAWGNLTPSGDIRAALYWYENQSLVGLAGRMFHRVRSQEFSIHPDEVSRTAVLLGWGFRLALLGWLGALMRSRQERSSDRSAGEWSLVITGMLLLSPMSRDYYAVFLMPAYLLLVHALWRRGQGWNVSACWLGASSYLLVGQGFPLGIIHRLPSLMPGVDNFQTYLHYGVPTLGYLLLIAAWAQALREGQRQVKGVTSLELTFPAPVS